MRRHPSNFWLRLEIQKLASKSQAPYQDPLWSQRVVQPSKIVFPNQNLHNAQEEEQTKCLQPIWS